MKRLLHKSLLTLGLVAALWPWAAFAEDAPLEMPNGRKIGAGVTVLQHQGQSFRFTTQVPLCVSITTVSPTVIEVKFVAPAGTSPGQVTLYWVNFEKTLYEDPAPVGNALRGVLSTVTGDFSEESGFVDR